MARIMESLKRFFTLEEESYSSSDQGVESESAEPEGGRLSNHPRHVGQQHQPPPGAGLARQRNNLVSLQAGRKQEIVVLEATSFGDAREVAEALKLKKCILLTLRKTEKEVARRIVDFLLGICYAVEGKSQKVADHIYLFVPAHMDIVIPDHHEAAPNAKQEELLSSGDGL